MTKHSSTLALAVACIFALLPATISAVDRNELEKTLQSQWKGKLKIMRQPCAGDQLAYDIRSGPIGACKQYEWANDTVIQIKKIRVTDDGFRIDAQRVILGFTTKTGRFAAARSNQQVRVEVHLGHHPTDASEADKFFATFAADPRTGIADVAPAYWQMCMRGEMRKRPQTKRWFCEYPRGSSMPATAQPNPSPVTVFKPITRADGTHGYAVENVLVYHFERGKITPPKEIFSPEPSYPQAARYSRLQGSTTLRVIIDETGHPSDIQIVSPLGSGFDEESVRTVKSWKFQPATVENKPVPVVVNIEVNFRLY